MVSRIALLAGEVRAVNIEDAMQIVLEESGKDHSQVCKIKTEGAQFVKGHSLPEEIRSLFVDAVDCLVARGALKLVIRNQDLDLYELTQSAWRLLSVQRATELIMEELATNVDVYKIHSEQGEFVQCGEKTFNQIDQERIVFLRALQGLMRSGKIQVVSENKQLCRFALANRSQSLQMTPRSLQKKTMQFETSGAEAADAPALKEAS